MGMVWISKTAKAPVAHFMNWNMSEINIHNKAEDKMYFGPSPLSQVACHQSQAIAMDLDELLNAEALGDMGKWGKAFDIIPETHHEEARLFIVSLVLYENACWFFRVSRLTNTFPLLLLLFFH